MSNTRKYTILFMIVFCNLALHLCFLAHTNAWKYYAGEDWGVFNLYKTLFVFGYLPYLVPAYGMLIFSCVWWLRKPSSFSLTALIVVVLVLFQPISATILFMIVKGLIERLPCDVSFFRILQQF